MELSFENFVLLAGFGITIMGFCWGIIKHFNTQAHSRMSKIETTLTQRIDHVEEHAASRKELSQSVDSVKELVRSIREEQHRMASRLDDFVKWVMEMNKEK